MTAPATAPETDPRTAARAEARARWSARQVERAARQAGHEEERAIRDEWRASRSAARQARREDRASRAMGTADGAGSWARRAAPVAGAAVPVMLVNATAFVGQFAWVQAHVPWPEPLQVMFAVALESVAVYLAWHAHLAQLANDSAGRLKMGAYLFALVIGLMNYSHYAPHWHPHALAVALGLMSTLSPWLWGVHSRRASRDLLKARGLIEEHAVRLGANRVMWHPLRSMMVMSDSAWTGERDPQRAIGAYEARQSAHRETWRASRAIRKAARQPGAPELAQVAQQPAIEPGAPVAQDDPARHVAQLPVSAPTRPALERLADAGIIQLGDYDPKPPSGAADVIPGTELNGRPVMAIASLGARPTMGRAHEILAEVTEAVARKLDSAPLGELPSERDVARMLCPEHDHRRQAKPLLAARREKGDAAPVLAQRQRPAVGPTPIAVPVSNLPGGKQANG